MSKHLDLYKILGVKPDATREEIKRAYREKAKKYHPDKGGDGNKFRDISLAHNILINPKKRVKYDTTGEFENRETNIINEAGELLIHYFNEIVSKTGDDVIYIDIIEKILDLLQKNKIAIKEKHRETVKEIRKCLALKNRLIRKNEYHPPFLVYNLTNKYELLIENLKKLKMAGLVTEKTIELLKDYEFDAKEKPPAPTAIKFVWDFSGTS